MKKYLCSMGAWVVLATITANGQTSSSGPSGSGTSQGTSSGTQGTTSSSSSQGNQQNLPPGLQNREQLPPGLQNREQLPPGLAKRTNNLSNFGTNQFGGASRLGTNSSGLYPTGRYGETNRNYGTNSGLRGSSFGTNSNSQGGQHDSFGANDRENRTQHRDEAVTAQDKTLLVNIRQKVQTEVRAIASSAGAWAPVNFKCDRGVVTIFGTVQSIEIKQQIDECVRRVPGVVRVEDTIVIAGNAGGAVGGGDSDQILVTRVRERVLPEIQIRGIDFQCHGGVVTVIGSVPQPEVKERLIALVRQVPGVVNVTDQITVNAEVQGQARTEESRQPREEKSQQTQAGRPEQTQQGLSERQRAVSAGIETSKTNLPPTGREGSLPPGLEKKEQLPPGLQNRDELPPGLSKRTNDSTRPNP